MDNNAPINRSAVQVIPNIAQDVNQLYVYQRTASWIKWKHDFAYSGWWKRLLRWSPAIHRLYRWTLFAKVPLFPSFPLFSTSSPLLLFPCDFAYRDPCPLRCSLSFPLSFP